MSILDIFIIRLESKLENSIENDKLIDISNYPDVHILWVNDISEVMKLSNSEYIMILEEGDIVTAEYINKFMAMRNFFRGIYQPKYSYLIQLNKDIFLRENQDITYDTDELGVIFYYPHYSKHIILPRDMLDQDICGSDYLLFLEKSIFKAIKTNTIILTLKNTLTIEYIEDYQKMCNKYNFDTRVLQNNLSPIHKG